MPQLTFELANPRFVFYSDEDGDKNELLFDGRLCLTGTLTIILHNGELIDGSLLECNITVSERKAPTALDQSMLETYAAKNDSRSSIREQRGLLMYSPAWMHGDTEQVHQPHLELQFALPPLAFNALHNAEPQQHTIYFHFSNKSYGEALAYGNDPEGGEILWKIAEETGIYAEEVSLILVPKPQSLKHP